MTLSHFRLLLVVSYDVTRGCDKAVQASSDYVISAVDEAAIRDFTYITQQKATPVSQEFVQTNCAGQVKIDKKLQAVRKKGRKRKRDSSGCGDPRSISPDLLAASSPSPVASFSL